MVVDMKELSIKCRYGNKAALSWGEGNPKKILALHGWLDNAASFYHLAPLLAEKGYEVVAVDFAGHGHSDYRAQGHYAHFIDYVLDIQDVLTQLNWKKPILLGHSMGAAMSVMYSATFPEKIDKNIMIENVGPVPSYGKGEAASNLREALLQWQAHSEEHTSFHKNIDSALQARLKVTPMEAKYLKPMVERGLKKTSEGYHWRTDKRLRLRSLFRFSEEIVQDILSSPKPDTLLILAKPFTYALSYPTAQQRIEKLSASKVVFIEGNHHLHMDKSEQVFSEIESFLE